ncbi:hypothetical protein [Lentzea albida]|uniref:Uncharacterized protein n=1 Tax=Lentzea albida TaxID=65499 RepID=A0A1H9J0K0_9PSEU|nr:hypothetical protein [Lentzea albida]SEQ80363.1 hypothetical protein SAMN04488000_104409 [Lentzea albida]
MKANLPRLPRQGLHVVHNDAVTPYEKRVVESSFGVIVEPPTDPRATQLSLLESVFELRVAATAADWAMYVDELRPDGLLVRAATPSAADLPRHTMPVEAFDRIGLVRFDRLVDLDPGPVPFMSVGASPAEGHVPTSVDEIVDRITALVAEHAPGGWTEVRVGCDAVAGWQLLTTSARTADGSEVHWLPPVEVTQWFVRLRAASYRRPDGTWYRADYVLRRGELPTLHTDAIVEPLWKPFFRPKSSGMRYGQVRHELACFPRQLHNTPDWLVVEAASAYDVTTPAELPTRPQDPPVMLVRTFDGFHADETPKLFRPAISYDETQRVLSYLENAPSVLTSRGLAPDLLDPSRTEQVPMSYHTDGRWVWAGSVAHYLRHHGICPDPVFLAHIRLHGYELPERIPSPLRARALSAATDQLSALETSTDVQASLEPGIHAEFAQAADAVHEVARHLDLAPSSYSLSEAVDGALCLVRVGDRYSVFWQHDGDRRFYAEFDTPGDAATYLIGFFYSYHNALRQPSVAQ